MALSGIPLLASAVARVPIASLSNNSEEIVFVVESPRVHTTYAHDSHGVVGYYAACGLFSRRSTGGGS